jgi:SAM-dependent methyltransferase
MPNSSSSPGRPLVATSPWSAVSRVHTALRQQWARFALHGVQFSDKYSRLDNLYRIHDPWGMEGEPEQFRFRETDRLIVEQFGHVGTILEIGCGEGHQSHELLKVCDDLVGVDVSARAVERAKTRCPGATFVAGDIFTSDFLQGRRFDLVVACEVLYYIQDVAAALARFRELGDAALVTYYDLHAETLDPYVLAAPEVGTSKVTFGSASWTVAWWRDDSQAGRAPASAT